MLAWYIFIHPCNFNLKNLCANARNAGDTNLILGSGRFPWGVKGQPTPLFLPRKSCGQRHLVGHCPWSCKRVRHNWACTHACLYLQRDSYRLWIVGYFFYNSLWQALVFNGFILLMLKVIIGRLIPTLFVTVSLCCPCSFFYFCLLLFFHLLLFWLSIYMIILSCYS